MPTFYWASSYAGSIQSSSLSFLFNR